jgi:hypothetical protein
MARPSVVGRNSERRDGVPAQLFQRKGHDATRTLRRSTLAIKNATGQRVDGRAS